MISFKNTSRLLSLLLVVFFGGVLSAHAIEYIPLAPLPIGEGGALLTTSVSLGSYLTGMIKFLIAFGGAVSIVTAIIGGVQRIASGISPSAKADANKRIENAFVGLALVLTSYLILNSINPDLVNINLNLPTITTTTSSTLVTMTNDTTATTVATAVLLTDPSLLSENYWVDDKYWRDQLIAGGVTIQRTKVCGFIGDTECTSVSSLGQSAIDGLIALAKSCECTPAVTGGTEFWLHGNGDTDVNTNNTQHKPGYSVVDLSKSPTKIYDYINKNVANKNQTANGTQYSLYNGDIYLDETTSTMSTGDHWHVTFY